MAREEFKSVNFRQKSLDLIRQCNDIIDDYMGQSLRLTLRQLYYQLVSRNIIPNKDREYKNLSSLVSDARLSGLMDWSAIEDRVRVPRQQNEYADLDELAKAALASYRLPRWEGQNAYVELWVEKDALAGVLSPLAREFHVTMMVNRGYSSQSAMYESAQRLGAESNPMIFYLGDHDPSGEDMVRDISERFTMFGVYVDVRKIALTMAQIRQYNPPPNPAKVSDPRAAEYVAKHGASSWEVDALPPNVLSQLIRNEFVAVVDQDLMDAVKRREEVDKVELRKAVAKLMKKKGK